MLLQRLWQINQRHAPTDSNILGRCLLGRIEEGKGEAYATRIDVRCSDRNCIVAQSGSSLPLVVLPLPKYL